MTKYRKGSAGAAEAKEAKIFRVIWTLVVGVIFSMCYFNLFSTYFFQYQVRSGVVADIASCLCFIGSAGVVWFSDWLEVKGVKGQHITLLMFGLLAVAILFSAGFNFDLHGIETDSMNQYNPNAAPAQ